MVHSSALLGFASLIITLAAALGVALPVFKAKSTSATIDLLRQELEIQKQANQDQQIRNLAMITQLNVQISELKGQISTLTKDFAAVIAKEVVNVIRAK